MARQHLVDAIRRGDSKAVEDLLATGVDANSRDASGMTALMQAAFFGWEDVALLLLANGADARPKDRLGLTAMDWAFRRGHSEVAEILNRGTAVDDCQTGSREASQSNGTGTGPSSNKEVLPLVVSHFGKAHGDHHQRSLTFRSSVPPNDIEESKEERTQEIEQLRAALAGAYSQIERLGEEKTAETANLAQSLSDARIQLSDFQREKALEVGYLTTELRRTQQEAVRLEEERKNEIAALLVSLKDAQNQLNEIEQERAEEINRLKVELSQSNQKIEELTNRETAGISLKLNLEEAWNEIKRIEQERVVEVEQLTKELEERHRQLEGIKKKKATEIQHLQLELNQARTKIESIEQLRAAEVERFAVELSRTRKEADEVNLQKNEAVKLLQLKLSEAQRNANRINQNHGAEIEVLRLQLGQLQKQVKENKDQIAVDVLRSDSFESGNKGEIAKTSIQKIKELEEQLEDALKQIEEAEQKVSDAGRLNWELGEALRIAEEQAQQNAKEVAGLKLQLAEASSRPAKSTQPTISEEPVRRESSLEQSALNVPGQHFVGRIFSTDPPIPENRLVPALIIVGLLLGAVIGFLVNYQLFSPASSAENVSPKPAINEPTPEVKRVTTGGMLQGKEVSLIVPDYPPAALTAGASGKVTVQVEIDRRGNVIFARVLDGPSIFRSVAVLAARKSKFLSNDGSSRQRRLGGTIIYNFPPQDLSSPNDTEPTVEHSDSDK